MLPYVWFCNFLLHRVEFSEQSRLQDRGTLLVVKGILDMGMVDVWPRREGKNGVKTPL